MKRGNMNWRLAAVAAGLVAVLAAVSWLWLRHPADKAPAQTETADSRPSKTNTADSKPRKGKSRDKNNRREHKPVRKVNPEKGGKVQEPNHPEVTNTEEESEPASEEEQLVEAFDSMTDAWREPGESDVPMTEVEKFRQQFNKIPDNRKDECLHRALNLLPDENVMLLMGILLDKEQPAEYLELVFNDILNRGEDVKTPLLQLIYKDKEHPCWASTAWILDVTGETPGK